MIDPIGTRPSAVPAKTVATPTTTEQNTSNVISAQSMVKEMAAKPPVDSERVDIIRSAIAHGRFPITPATIADRLIAYAEGWRPS
jgi:negative regulator of flagellin synthesis FlgM